MEKLDNSVNETELEKNDPVRDELAPEGEGYGRVMRVLKNMPCDEYVLRGVEGNPTVAEFNENYPAKDPVILMRFDEDVSNGYIREYAYPASRLKKTE